MMPLDDSDSLKRFLLTGYNAHCPFCVPGGFASIVAIPRRSPAAGDRQAARPHGTLRLLSDTKSATVPTRQRGPVCPQLYIPKQRQPQLREVLRFGRECFNDTTFGDFSTPHCAIKRRSSSPRAARSAIF
jgi:hypothetical protein